MFRIALVAALLLVGPAAIAGPQVDRNRVLGHEAFLAGPQLHGRGSLTPDEATAAAYVAAQFQGYGLQHAPTMDSYLQSAPVLRHKLHGTPVLLLDGVPVAGATLLSGAGGMAGGRIAVVGRGDPAAKAEALVVPTANVPRAVFGKAASAAGATLIVVPEDAGTRRTTQALGGRPRLPDWFADAAPRIGGAMVVSVPEGAIAAFTRAGAKATLVVPFELERASTTNAVAYLPGTDPTAGLLLLTAHLDHLGTAPDGQMWPGANDDASGVVALLEIARNLAAGKRPRRGILFVAYGSEEAGGFGARWFGDHPPVPLSHISANIEFEMLGARVPKLAADRLMMTGYERSNLGAVLKAHGALIDADPYPEQNYFRRSDNYALALRGVVAHTVSGWGAEPNYHTPGDTIANLDLDYMITSIDSLIRPIRWLADSRFEPKWTKDGQPKE